MSVLKVLLFLFIAQCAHAQSDLDIEIIGVYDGDTLKVDILHVPKILGKSLSVRIAGVDTPEIRTLDLCEKKKGFEARDFLAELIMSASSVHISHCIRGKFFRLVCELRVDGELVSEILIQEGLGIAYNGGTRPRINWCEGLL